MVIGSFQINGYPVSAILDTGATGSFIAEYASIMPKLIESACPIYAPITTPDNQTLIANQMVKTKLNPSIHPQYTAIIELIIIPDRVDLLNQQVILGLDSLKALNINFETAGNQMIATINRQVVGQEIKSEQNSLFAMKVEPIETDLSFTELNREYADIFAESASSFIKTQPMTIPVSVDFSTRAKLRPKSIEDIIEINRQVHKLIENDIVERSESNFSANVHLVPKKNGQKRMVVDFRFLNSITIKDHYPLPQITEMFLALNKATHFTALDCTDGFLQIPILNEHRHRTAFITSQGSFHYKRCPFGFTNSPAKFQRTMNEIFEEGLYTKCVIYIDDILVFGQSEEELRNNLEWAYSKCREFNVKLKFSKCKINQTRVEFLGFEISCNKICPVKGKYDTLGIDKPTKSKHVRAILGTLNHYARFIKNYADKTAPLRKMTCKNAQIIWTPELTALVDSLKDELNQPCELVIPDSTSHKKIDIRISQFSIEITCFNQNGDLIGRAGSALSEAEKGYTTVELQLCAIVLAYEKYYPFLRGRVTFRTTCKSLQNALKATNRTERITRIMLHLPPDIEFDLEIVPGPTPTEEIITDDAIDEVFYTDGACRGNGTRNGKASWAVLAIHNPHLSKSGIVDYERPTSQVAEITAAIQACQIAADNKFKDIVIVTDSRYVMNSIERWIDIWKNNDWKDKKNKPVVNQHLLKKLAEFQNDLNIKVIHVKAHASDMYNIRVDKMAQNLLIDGHKLGAISLGEPIIDQNQDPEIEMIKANLDMDASLQNRYTIIDDQLYYIDYEMPWNARNRIFVPKATRYYLLRLSHEDSIYGGHTGIKKTRDKLKLCYWPHMGRDIEKFVKSCTTCQLNKTPRKPKYGFLHPIPPNEIFERIHIDIIGPMHESEKHNRYIITAIDSFSRYAYARAVSEVKTSDVIEFMMEEIFTKHGCPSYLVSDNGTQFTSTQFQTYLKTLGINHNRTCEYHPQANGLDERLNGTLVRILKNYINPDQSDWDVKLQWAVFLYNTTNHSTTLTSPYTILYGVEPKVPLRAIQRAALDESTDGNEPAHARIREFVRNAILKSQLEQKKYYNRKRSKPDFKLLDAVYAKKHYTQRGLSDKLQPDWEGPYFIYKIITINNQPISVVLVDEKTGKFRRSSFQDLKHAELNDDIYQDCLQQTLPGEIMQMATSLALSDQINDNQHVANQTSVASTTQPTGFSLSRPWQTDDDATDTQSDIRFPDKTASITDDNIKSSNNYDTSQWDEIIPRNLCEQIDRAKTMALRNGTNIESNTDSSAWDELIPRSGYKAKVASERNQITLSNRVGQTDSEVVTYKRAEEPKTSGQTAQVEVRQSIINQSHGQTVAELSQTSPKDLNNCSQTATAATSSHNTSVNNHIISQNPATITTCNLCDKIPTPEDSSQTASRDVEATTDVAQAVVQSSTPIAPMSHMSADESCLIINEISDITNPIPPTVYSINPENTNQSLEQMQARPKRNAKLPDRYQASK